MKVCDKIVLIVSLLLSTWFTFADMGGGIDNPANLQSIASDVKPITNATYSLGSATLAFQNAYIANAIYTNDGVLAIGGIGGTNNEVLKADFETTANTVALSSTTGVDKFLLSDIVQFTLGPATSSGIALVRSGSELRVRDGGNTADYDFRAGSVTIGSNLNGTQFSAQHGRSLASRLLGMMTACKLLYIPLTETGAAAGTSVDLSSLGHTLTYTGTAAARMGYKGFMKAYAFNGTSDYLTTPDAADLSFGDGSVDVPWSCWAVINVTDTAANKAFITKRNAVSNTQEFYIYLTGGEAVNVVQTDQSSGKSCSRTSDAALSAGYHFVVYTNTGTGGATAMSTGLLYVDGRVVASTATEDAGYVSMENLGAPLMIGGWINEASFVQGFPSVIGCAGVTAEALSAATIWKMWLDIAGEYNLTVS